MLLSRRSSLPFRLPPLALFALGWLGCRQSSFPEYPQSYREFAYVANRGANTVSVLDLVNLRTDRTLQVGNAPTALAANPAGDEVYVVNAQPEAGNGSVSVIDTTKNAVVATIPVGRAPAAIVVESTGARAFVVNTGSNTVSLIDLPGRRVIASAATGERPEMAAVSTDGRTLTVANLGGGSLSIFSVAAVGQAHPLRLRTTVGGCPGATSPVILPNASKVFAACSGSHQVMAVALGALPGAAAQVLGADADRLLALLDVGLSPGHLALKPDGGEIFVSNTGSDTISEIATETVEVGSTYPIGNRPAHALVSSDNSALWVSNAGAESLSLYSIDDGRFVSSLHTGMAPDALAFSADGHLLLVADTRSGDVAVIRTSGKLGPALFTLLPAGNAPAAIAIKAMNTPR